jgi:hypothetical protein
MASVSIVIADFRPRQSGTLRGFFTATVASGGAFPARVYTIGDAAEFHLPHRVEAYHRPRLRPCGCGPPLIRPSQQRLTASVDQLFDQATHSLLPPRQSAATQWDDDDAA